MYMFFVDPSKLQNQFKAREAAFAGDASFCFLQKVSICFPLHLQLNSKLHISFAQKFCFKKSSRCFLFASVSMNSKPLICSNAFLQKALLFDFLLRFQSNSNLPEKRGVGFDLYLIRLGQNRSSLFLPEASANDRILASKLRASKQPFIA